MADFKLSDFSSISSLLNSYFLAVIEAGVDNYKITWQDFLTQIKSNTGVVQGDLISNTVFEVGGNAVIPDTTRLYIDVASQESYFWNGSNYIAVSSVIPTIGVNGNWYIGGIDTNKPSQGANGVSPHIDVTSGNWFVGLNDTGIKARGDDGDTPTIDPTSKNWFIGGLDTGVKAEATAPVISPTTGNWVIDGVDTNIKASYTYRVAYDTDIVGNRSGTDSVFQLPGNYISGTVRVFKGGVILQEGTGIDWIEESPNEIKIYGTVSSDLLTIFYAPEINTPIQGLIVSYLNQAFTQPSVSSTVTAELISGIDWLKAGVRIYINGGGQYTITNIGANNLYTIRLDVAETAVSQPVTPDICFPILPPTGGGGMTKVQDDSSPKLGGSLDADMNRIFNLAAPASASDPIRKVDFEAQKIEDHSDIDITGLANGYIIYWDNAASKWKVKAESGGGASSLVSLTDVDITGQSNNDVIYWDSGTSKWKAKQVSGGSGITKVEDDTSPKLGGDLDANSKKISGLLAASSNTEPIRKQEFDALKLIDLADTDILTPIDNHNIIYWNATTGKWEVMLLGVDKMQPISSKTIIGNNLSTAIHPHEIDARIIFGSNHFKSFNSVSGTFYIDKNDFYGTQKLTLTGNTTFDFANWDNDDAATVVLIVSGNYTITETALGDELDGSSPYDSTYTKYVIDFYKDSGTIHSTFSRLVK